MTRRSWGRAAGLRRRRLARSLRLLHEQADRPRRPRRRPAGAGRHRGAPARQPRDPERAGPSCSPPTPPRWSPATTSTSSSRSSAASSRPAAAAGRAGGRQERGHREQGAAGRGRRDACTPPPRKAGVDLYSRRRWPARSRCCARCASRWPGTGSPGHRHRQRHDQLHPRPAWTTTGAGLRRGARRGHRAGLRRGRPDGGRRGLRRRRQGRDPRRAGLPHPGHRRRRVPRGHHRGHRRRHAPAPGDGLRR